MGKSKATLGSRLREARKASEMTMRQIEHAAEIDREMIYRYERGQNNPTAGVLARLAVALGVSADWLLGI